MTDSMKFGPEWLRNKSADSTNLSSGNAAGGGNVQNSSALTYAYPHNSSNTSTNSGTAKNMFPEFRYGREEMLSLFDKSCNLPDILPSFKKIFVERVQNPLALTPTTDEETTTQVPTIATQRPTWMQRSPVGFSSALRGAGRGGSVERGRMRGKPMYHGNFTRPTALFDDDLRTLKSERAWSDRNGAGDSLGGIFGVGSDWNGTPVSSSPRKEFSSHPRNMENWRRNRNEDGSGDAAVGINPSSDGWRGSSNSGFNGANRWGRSTSWRDEDGTGGNGEGNTISGGGVPMQRSYSTIATSVSDRGNFGNSGSSKGLQNSASFVNGSHRANSGNGLHSQKWLTCGKNEGGPVDGDDNLPEWAMENPSDCGGSFDSSGAFLGSADENASTKDSKLQDKDVDHQTKEEIKLVEREVHSPGSIDSYLSSPASQDSKDRENDTPKHENNHKKIEVTAHEISEIDSENLERTKDLPDSNTDLINKDSASATPAHLAFENPIGDFSDRMKEVADDMVEKLIMDDDNDEMNTTNKFPEVKLNSPPNVATELERNSFASPEAVGILKESTHQHVSNPIALSPSHPSLEGAGGHELFRSGVMVDHPIMHHHNLQHHLAAAPGVRLSQTPHPLGVANSTELWFYRDPQSKVQGPFNSIEMTEWYRAGYFNDNLYVRRVCDSRFRSLGELIKICHGNMPFTHSNMIPVGVDLQIPIGTAQIHEKPHSVHDLGLDVPSEHHDIKREATALADSIIAVKSLLNPLDMGNILNSHFQMFQDKHIRSQELIVLAELSKNERFQQLPRPEQESVVRQKVQLIGLPQHLTSLTGLSNTLAALNPAVGQHLLDTIAECSKKGNVIPGNAAAGQQHPLNFMDVENIILNAHHRPLQTPFNNPTPYLPILRNRNENNTDFNMRMYMQCENADKQQGVVGEPKSEFLARPNSGDFLAEQQLPSSSSTSGAPPVMQMWMPQIHGAANTTPQTQLIAEQHPANQWTAGRLVGMPSAVMAASAMMNNGAVVTPNPIPVSMWNSDLPVEQELKNPPGDDLDFQKNVDIQLGEELTVNNEMLDGEVHKVAQNEDLKNETYENREIQCNEKLNANATKQVASGGWLKKNKQPAASTTMAGKSKEEMKRIEEERRREQAEEKRKLKDEKKRQVLEEEKKKLHQQEEEKRRQTDEEKERLLLIQAQRRKALLGVTNASTTTSVANSSGTQQNMSKSQYQTSVAPWSVQASTAVAQTGPGLAEIQKAERRERRADQQRQLENIEKQLRANAIAVAEANEVMVKWNASTVPVKSFAEIQAEESKRLAAEQLEMQRRKEQEQQAMQLTLMNGGNASGSGNVQAIWGGTKVWGSTSTTGFWEEPVRFSAAAAAAPHKSATTVAGIVAAGLEPNRKQSQQPQSSKIGTNSSRSLKKSQTVSVMQNTTNASNSNKNSKAIGQPVQQSPASSTSKQQQIKTQQQKPDNDKKIARTVTSMSPPQKKTDDFESEFTGWCTASLLNMQTKVDVPTFVQFLQDIESPYEVKDYIRMYLGETKEYVEFAKQFLERRSKYKNLQRAQNAHNDDMCKPAPAITPSGNDNFENKAKQKKAKKSKMTKLDARILGFSVTAASGRINVGDRDYVDAP